MEDSVELKVVCTSEGAHLPTKGSSLSAGYDLQSAEKVCIPVKTSKLIATNIKIQLPPGTYGRISPRSGLALNHQIDVLGGIIDEDYRGEVGVILINHGDQDFNINPGDRIAQLIVHKIVHPKVMQVKNLSDTERNEKGFGSTGK